MQNFAQSASRNKQKPNDTEAQMDNEQRHTKAKLAVGRWKSRPRSPPAEINHAQPAAEKFLCALSPRHYSRKALRRRFFYTCAPDSLCESARIYANRAIFCSLPSIFLRTTFQSGLIFCWIARPQPLEAQDFVDDDASAQGVIKNWSAMQIDVFIADVNKLSRWILRSGAAAARSDCVWAFPLLPRWKVGRRNMVHQYLACTYVRPTPVSQPTDRVRQRFFLLASSESARWQTIRICCLFHHVWRARRSRVSKTEKASWPSSKRSVLGSLLWAKKLTSHCGCALIGTVLKYEI